MTILALKRSKIHCAMAPLGQPRRHKRLPEYYIYIYLEKCWDRIEIGQNSDFSFGSFPVHLDSMESALISL